MDIYGGNVNDTLKFTTYLEAILELGQSMKDVIDLKKEGF